jgi:5'-nucleotidase
VEGVSEPTRFLLTNDDGIDAPGLAALEAALAAAGAEVWVAAPDGERSTCSHGMTLYRPLFTREAGPRRFAVDGTPADCVYWALFGGALPRPAAVLSGINRGANLGSDVIYSGTVAGAREAAMRGVHGIGASLVDGDAFDAPARAVAEVALRLARGPAAPVRLLNLNFPGGGFGGIRAGRLGRRLYPEVVETRRPPGRGGPYHWLGGPPVEDAREPGTDGWLVARGFASATALALDQTDHETMREPEWMALVDATAEGEA